MWRNNRVEELASPQGFARDPELIWTWYNERRAAHARAEPSPAHRVLARWEQRFAQMTLATQNVDSLHRRAGSTRLLELHGHLRSAVCTRCGATRDLDPDGMPLDAIGHDCGGRFRPQIVWFGESLPPDVLAAAVAAARSADVAIVAGTSALVEPAASLISRCAADAFTIEINPEATAISQRVDVCLRGGASEVLSALDAHLG